MENSYRNLLKTRKEGSYISQLSRDINASFSDSISLVCRGKQMRNVTDFRNQLCAVLQFPYYYSGVFASLDECICDLDWIPKKRIFVFILDSDYILLDEPCNYFDLFERSTEEVFASSREFGGIPKNVYYIFQNIDKEFPLFEDKDISEYS